MMGPKKFPSKNKDFAFCRLCREYQDHKHTHFYLLYPCKHSCTQPQDITKILLMSQLFLLHSI